MVQTKMCFVTKAALRKRGRVRAVRLSKSTRNLHTERVFTLVIHSKKYQSSQITASEEACQPRLRDMMVKKNAFKMLPVNAAQIVVRPVHDLLEFLPVSLSVMLT